MQYKKFFSAAALVTLLSVSNYLSADPMGSEEESTSYYVRGQYNAEFFNTMSGKEVEADHTVTGTFAKLMGYSKGTSSAVASGYKPNYNTSFITGSAAAGYKMEDIRVELEGLYSKLDVDVAGYSASSTAITPAEVKKFGIGTLAGDTDSNLFGTNEGFTTMAAMINAYYDVDLGNESIPVSPYVGVGLGVARVNFAGADHWKPAYQAKAGVSYAVTSDINVYGGYRYFGLYGDTFEKVAIARTGGVTSKKEVTLKQLEGVHGVHGIEAGVMFNF